MNTRREFSYYPEDDGENTNAGLSQRLKTLQVSAASSPTGPIRLVPDYERS